MKTKNPMIGATLALLSFLFLGLVGIAQEAAQSRPETTTVQMINATSVPRISVEINGRLIYKELPQGMYGGDVPTEFVDAKYKIRDLVSGVTYETNLTHRPNEISSLVMVGDFSTNKPPDFTKEGNGKFVRCQFLEFTHDLEKSENPIRYRFINGCPEISVEIEGPDHLKKQLSYGESAVWSGVGKQSIFQVSASGQKFPVLMRQDGLIRNGIVVFYDTGSKVGYRRVFENTLSEEAE